MAKTQHVKQKQQKQAGEKIAHTVSGNVLTGYFILDPQGNRVDESVQYENMWDAINERKRLDAS